MSFRMSAPTWRVGAADATEPVPEHTNATEAELAAQARGAGRFTTATTERTMRPRGPRVRRHASDSHERGSSRAFASALAGSTAPHTNHEEWIGELLRVSRTGPRLRSTARSRRCADVHSPGCEQ